jgi:hypothetical protein
MLLEPKLRVDTRKELPGVCAGREPGPTTDKGHKRTPRMRRARDLCHEFVTFFKIGYDYDWEEQYKEYSEYWKNYFQAPNLQ